MIIDCHTHIRKIGDIKALKESMQVHNIDKSVILYDCGMKTPSQTDVLKAIESEDSLCLALSVSITFPSATKRQFAEINNLIKHPKVVGVKLYPGYEYFYANDLRCYPIYDLCNKHNKTVCCVLFEFHFTVNQ